ncbi:hypothetical protein KIPB_016121, partial [Kipferlia bialata]
LCWEYNHLCPDDVERRDALIHQILPNTEGTFPFPYVEPTFFCDFG